ncbi:hypothetical protein OAO91_03325 [Luminiphilus sp.]|nr:hypothetical protein [Luminiphilus sp.]
MGTVSKPLLSILIPSHRSDARAYHSLSAAADFLEQFGSSAEVIISDNSGDNAKWLLMKDISRKVPQYRILKGPEDIRENFQNTLSHAAGSHVLQIGDDDILNPETAIRVCNAVASVQAGASSGIVAPFAQNLGGGRVRHFKPGLLTSVSVSERVSQLCKFIPVGNPAFQSIWRRDRYLAAWALATNIPVRQHWHDHLVVLFGYLKSAFIEVPTPWTSYNFESWTRDEISSREAALTQFWGLPISVNLVYRAILGFEGAQLIMRMIGDATSARIWLKAWMGAFRAELKRYERDTSIFNACPHWSETQRFKDYLLNIQKSSLNELGLAIERYYLSINVIEGGYLDFWLQYTEDV